jgi:hypothetical protein
MFEHRQEPLAPKSVFYSRIARSAGAGFFAIFISLFAGMAGYHYIEDIPWVAAYQEAALILSGMGPAATMQTDLGKIFAGTYALYSGLALILTVGVIIAPIVHRFFHKFHLDFDED